MGEGEGNDGVMLPRWILRLANIASSLSAPMEVIIALPKSIDFLLPVANR